jgi:hypothetical protein
MQVKSIKMVAGGTQLTVETDDKREVVAKTYWDNDGKDKVEIEGVTYEYEGGFTIRKALYQPKR